jgi:hypothetical protein
VCRVLARTLQELRPIFLTKNDDSTYRDGCQPQRTYSNGEPYKNQKCEPEFYRAHEVRPYPRAFDRLCFDASPHFTLLQSLLARLSPDPIKWASTLPACGTQAIRVNSARNAFRKWGAHERVSVRRASTEGRASDEAGNALSILITQRSLVSNSAPEGHRPAGLQESLDTI